MEKKKDRRFSSLLLFVEGAFLTQQLVVKKTKKKERDSSCLLCMSWDSRQPTTRPASYQSICRSIYLKSDYLFIYLFWIYLSFDLSLKSICSGLIPSLPSYLSACSTCLSVDPEFLFLSMYLANIHRPMCLPS